MARMTKAEKELLVSIILQNSEVLENKRTDDETLAVEVERWEKIGKEFNSHGQVTKRSWKLLWEAWNEIKTNEKKMQADNVNWRMASGSEALARAMFHPTLELETAISLEDFKENIGRSDSINLDVCPISSNTESAPRPELPPPARAGEIIIDTSPHVEAVTEERERTSSSSEVSCSTARNEERKRAAMPAGFKYHNNQSHQIESIMLETAMLVRKGAEADLKHSELQVQVQQTKKENAELQRQILVLQKQRLEQLIAKQREMHLMEMKMRSEGMRKRPAIYKPENSSDDESKYQPTQIKQARFTDAEEASNNDIRDFFPNSNFISTEKFRRVKPSPPYFRSFFYSSSSPSSQVEDMSVDEDTFSEDEVSLDDDAELVGNERVKEEIDNF